MRLTMGLGERWRTAPSQNLLSRSSDASQEENDQRNGRQIAPTGEQSEMGPGGK